MEISELKRNLQAAIKKHKDKMVGVGEIRIDYMVQDCLRAIEDLRQENEQLKGRIDTYHQREVLYGTVSDKNEELIIENERLQAQAARMREALEEATETIENIYEKDTPQTEKYREILNNDDAPAAVYHNPADVAALAKAREVLMDVSYRSGLGSAEDKIRDAIAAIDEIGGREDV